MDEGGRVREVWDCHVHTAVFKMDVGVGGRSKREGKYVYIKPIHSIVQQKLTQHYKAIICQ